LALRHCGLAGLSTEAIDQSFLLTNKILLVLKSFLLLFDPYGFFLFVVIKIT